LGHKGVNLEETFRKWARAEATVHLLLWNRRSFQ